MAACGFVGLRRAIRTVDRQTIGYEGASLYRIGDWYVRPAAPDAPGEKRKPARRAGHD